jgi:hypothetical protein
MALRLPGWIVAEIDALWRAVKSLNDVVIDLNNRLTNLENFLGRLALPSSSSSPSNPRWVLELFPDEVSRWREAIRTIPLEKLTTRERSFLRSMDYYLLSERKITLPQMAWLQAIIRKVGNTLPEIPLLTRSQSNKCVRCGSSIPSHFKHCPKCGVKKETSLVRGVDAC